MLRGVSRPDPASCVRFRVLFLGIRKEWDLHGMPTPTIPESHFGESHCTQPPQAGLNPES